MSIRVRKLPKCVEKSVKMFVKLKRENPHLIGLKRNDAKTENKTIFCLKK